MTETTISTTDQGNHNNDQNDTGIDKIRAGMRSIAEWERKLALLKQDTNEKILVAITKGNLTPEDQPLVDQWVAQLGDSKTELNQLAHQLQNLKEVPMALISYYTRNPQPRGEYKGFIMLSPQEVHAVTILATGTIELRRIEH